LVKLEKTIIPLGKLDDKQPKLIQISRNVGSYVGSQTIRGQSFNRRVVESHEPPKIYIRERAPKLKTQSFQIAPAMVE
jgi:hypothetical protein